MAARKAKRKNPRKHYPPLKNRGRPAKKKGFTITTIAASGKVITRRKIKTTHPEAERIALRLLKGKAAGVILDDHKRKK